MTRSFTEAEIKDIFARHRPRTDPPGQGLRQAAVLVPFYLDPEGLALVFTKRTEDLEQHRGQISFPGGMQDPADPDPLSTALRETQEEIGVDPADVEAWGRLNQQWTVTGFSVAPFVGAIPHPYGFRLNTQEVERLIIVPLAHLLDPAHFEEGLYRWGSGYYINYRYTYGQDVIWGATARMVHSLLTLLTTGREPVLEKP